MKKPCYTCQHRRCKPDLKSKGHAVAWSCGLKDIRFGYQFQYEAGENMPDRCADRLLPSK